MSGDLTQITPLSSEWNYGHWSVQIKAVLQSKGIWRHAKGRIPEPIKESGERESEFRIRQKEHEMDESKALLILQQSLSQNVIPHVRHLETAYDIWEYLGTKYYGESDDETKSYSDQSPLWSSSEAAEMGYAHRTHMNALRDRFELLGKELKSMHDITAKELKSMQDIITRLDNQVCAIEKKQESKESLLRKPTETIPHLLA